MGLFDFLLGGSNIPINKVYEIACDEIDNFNWRQDVNPAYDFKMSFELKRKCFSYLPNINIPTSETKTNVYKIEANVNLYAPDSTSFQKEILFKDVEVLYFLYQCGNHIHIGTEVSTSINNAALAIMSDEINSLVSEINTQYKDHGSGKIYGNIYKWRSDVILDAWAFTSDNIKEGMFRSEFINNIIIGVQLHFFLYMNVANGLVRPELIL